MKTAKALQQVIEAIARKHGVDLSASGAHLRLEQPHFMPLVIEGIGPHQVSVAHYTYQNGDAIADPDVELFTGYGPWVPVAIQQPSLFIVGLGATPGYVRSAWLKADGSAIARYAPQAQADLADFCETWANNLRDQGWLDL